MALTVELVSPEEIVYTGEAEMVVARTTDGEIAFQPGHVPFLGVLVPSEVRVYTTEGAKTHYRRGAGLRRGLPRQRRPPQRFPPPVS